MFKILSLLSESKNELESNSRNGIDRSSGDRNRKPDHDIVESGLRDELKLNKETVNDKVSISDSSVKDDKDARSTDTNTPANNH